jgi:hypothetical protein
MSINPHENLFTQLPKNVLELIGYFVAVDLLKEQELHPHKKPLFQKEDPIIEKDNEPELEYLSDETEIFNLIKQGWNYNGILANDPRLFLLTKSTLYKRYNRGLIITFNHHEIFYSRAHAKTNYTCVFKQQLPSPNIDSLLRINQFIHSDSFEFLSYFPDAHAITIRILNNINPALNNNIVVIPLPDSADTKPFLGHYFYKKAVCKPLLIEGGQE